MEYEITPERQAYLDARGHTILVACPGSGKTMSIIKKLYDVSRYCEQRYGRHTGFACLSFTNKACDELKQRYRYFHGERLCFPNEVATIDSFIMQKVVMPFWYLCGACKKKPVVVNDDNVLERIYYNNVFQNGQWHKYPLRELTIYARLMRRKNPVKVSRGKSGYLWNHNPATTAVDMAYCKAMFAYRLSKGYVTSSDALWVACDILEHHQDIAKALVMRFPYIIVDEAQDNSELHFMFFDLLKQAGLENLEFVGDICQSIYGFRSARPELLKARMESGDWNVMPLSECRRSNQRIINLYSKLMPKGLPAIISHNVADMGVPIVIYKYDDDNVRDVIRDFNQTCEDNGLKNRIILARGDSMCKKLAGVKDTPFRYWKADVPYLLIDAMFAADKGDMNEAFRKVRAMLAELKYPNDPDARHEYLLAVEHDADMNTKIYNFIQRLPALSLNFEDWTAQTCNLLQLEWELAEQPDFNPYVRKKDNQGRSMQVISGLPVEQYYQTNDEGSDYHKSVETIHGVKGASLDGVLLFLSDNCQGQNISLREFPDEEMADMSEKQRLIYVACSRARQFLALAVPNTVSDEEVSRVLNDVDLEIKSTNLQSGLVVQIQHETHKHKRKNESSN